MRTSPNSPKLELYGPEALALIPWPAGEGGFRALLSAYLLEGTPALVANVRTRFFVGVWDGRILPITVNRSEKGNSYVVSPFSHYVSYAREELRELKNPALERFFDLLLTSLGGLLAWGRLDHTVQVNNALFSTNLYSVYSREEVQAITAALAARFPDAAVLWRSISPNVLEQAVWPISPLEFPKPFRLIPSRSVLFLDAPSSIQHSKKDFKNDLKTLRSSAYHLRPAREHDLERIHHLYGLLYLDKYSRLNPQFTPAFFRLAFERGTLELWVLERSDFGVLERRGPGVGQVDGVLGFYTRGHMMTCPVLGYDTTLPQNLGLYRILSAYLVLEAEKRGLVLHASSGVARFKRSRGAVPAQEVSAVYDAHLSPLRRMAWKLLERAVRWAWRLLEVRGL